MQNPYALCTFTNHMHTLIPPSLHIRTSLLLGTTVVLTNPDLVANIYSILKAPQIPSEYCENYSRGTTTHKLTKLK